MVRYMCDWLTGVFTQSELGLLNNGELSPSPQFSLPRLTSSKSALIISSVDRARIIGEQGSDLSRVCNHCLYILEFHLGPLCLPVLRLISSRGEGWETSSGIGSSSTARGGEGEPGESWEQPKDSSVLSQDGT